MSPRAQSTSETEARHSYLAKPISCSGLPKVPLCCAQGFVLTIELFTKAPTHDNHSSPEALPELCLVVCPLLCLQLLLLTAHLTFFHSPAHKCYLTAPPLPELCTLSPCIAVHAIMTFKGAHP